MPSSLDAHPTTAARTSCPVEGSAGRSRGAHLPGARDDEPLRLARLAVATARRVVPPRPSEYAVLTHRPAAIAAGLGETVERVAGTLRGPRSVALDPTGLWLSPASRRCEWRAERERSQRGWPKWALAMWVEPRLLLAQRARPGPSGGFGDLIPLATAAHAVLSFERLVADAGYGSEASHRFCRERLGVGSLIPAKKRRSVRVVATTACRREMAGGSAGRATRRRAGPPAGAGRRGR